MTITEKITSRLVRQGRSHAEASRDAARWVAENMGVYAPKVVLGGHCYCPECDPEGEDTYDDDFE